ncbi:MAG: serine/threonine protein kinase [Polyangiaceae bacterium]|nr:serine/threonine protein kinase [Polyangiaceae bacterium]
MSTTPTQSMPPPVSVGELVAGKYRVLSILGSGGMGVVVAARHEELEQVVALKLVRPELGGSDSVAARFLREARAAARIQSDHVARVFDVGSLDDGRAYMVMEHLTGSDLSALLRERGPLSAEEAAGFGLEILEAVAHAHALGIIHRDLKPSNVFLARRPDGTKRIKVLDFGISKDTRNSSGSTPPGALTTGDAVLGSPAYMAPEQVKKSKDADVRSDIWSIGVILYELLAGKPPFHGETVMELLANILDCSPEPLSRVCPSVPPELESVVMRCLSRSPDQRFQDVASLAAALAPFAPEEKRPLVDRIDLIVKGADEKADGAIRISNPGASRVSQTAETLAAPPEAPKDADLPRGKEAISGDPTGASWAGAPSRSARPSPWLSIGMGVLVVATLSGLGLWAFSLGRGNSNSTVPVVPAAQNDTAPILPPSPSPSPSLSPSPSPPEPVLVIPSASAAAPPPISSAAVSAPRPKVERPSSSVLLKPSSSGNPIPPDLLRDRD